MLQEPDNKSKKIFSDKVKPYGHKHLPLSIVDIMLNNPGHPYTVSALRRALYKRKHFCYTIYAIQSSINCIADMQHITLMQHRVTRGRNTRVQAFTITIKQTNIDGLQENLFGERA